MLSEEEDELAFWDVEKRRQLTRLSLRGGAGPLPQAGRRAGARREHAGSRSEPTPEPASGRRRSSGVARGPRPGPGRPAGRRRVPRQRLAQIGPYIATVLPGERGSDCSTCSRGRRCAVLNRPDHTIVGVVGESTGRRLVTIESDAGCQRRSLQMPPPCVQVYSGTPTISTGRSPACPGARTAMRGRISVPAGGDQSRTAGRSPSRAHRGYGREALLGSRDGHEPLDDGSEIEPQAELSAIALGPNNMLATAGNTSGGGGDPDLGPRLPFVPDRA